MVKNSRDLKFSPYRRRSMQNRRTPAGGNAAPAANIKVVVRVRPPNSKELGENSRTCVRVIDDRMLIFDPKEESVPFFYHGVQQKGRDLLKRANKNMQFMFDTVFGFDSSNDDVFEKTTKDIISVIMDGYNCAVFVYGATGAGKTYTMLGKTNEPGITYLTMRELFTKMDSLREERDFDIAITYLEVYNEAVQDLLKPGKILQLREDSTYGVQVPGITFERIVNVEELLSLLDRGNQNRTQHPTDANKESSRSHAVFQVYVRMTTKTTNQVRMAKLSMIDLAGSERGAATGCSGMRFTEGANINRSLLALGNCINSLADGQRHVPYRDSKLTRLLKDSLGGNCHTVMIANVSPSSLSYEDTYNTLKYATRAKAIKMKMKKNIVNCELHVTQYKKMVEELQLENERLTKLLAAQATSTVSIPPSIPPSVSVSSVSTSTWEDGHENIEIDVDDLCAQLIEVFKEKRELSKTICAIESSKKTLFIRKSFKEDAENRFKRLRSFDQNSVSKSRERLASSKTVFEKQAATYENKLSALSEKQKAVDLKLNKLLVEARSILTESEIKVTDIICKEIHALDQTLADALVDHHSRLNKVRNVEMNVQNSLIKEMAEVIQLFYMVLEEKNDLTEPMRKDYTKLIKNLEGYRNVLWQDEDDNTDSAPINAINEVESLTSVHLNTVNFVSTESDLAVTENKCMSSSPLKRKIVDETFIASPKENGVGDTPLANLDYLNNYKKSPFRDSNKITADNILNKKPRIVKPVLNKLAQVPVTSVSSSLFKENRPVQRFPLRKKIGDKSKGMLSSQTPAACSAISRKPFTKPRTPFK